MVLHESWFTYFGHGGEIFLWNLLCLFICYVFSIICISKTFVIPSALYSHISWRGLAPFFLYITWVWFSSAFKTPMQNDAIITNFLKHCIIVLYAKFENTIITKIHDTVIPVAHVCFELQQNHAKTFNMISLILISIAWGISKSQSMSIDTFCWWVTVFSISIALHIENL